MYVAIATEGIIDEAVARRLLGEAGLGVSESYLRRGKSDLDPQIPGYCRAADHWPWFILRDLDNDASCAAELIASIVPHRGRYLTLRVAVRQVESWLLADRENLAGFLSVPVSRVPERPEELLDAKATLVDVARRSRHRGTRSDMTPREGSGAKVGPAYNAKLVEFVLREWDPSIAETRSDSLLRARRAVAAIEAPSTT